MVRNGGFKLVNVVTLEINTIHSDDLPSYTALSYIWSQKQHQNTDLFESITDLQSQEKLRVWLDALPRTLREAILFARDLELTFIWIDELCIDQAHSSMKSYIIKSMGAIYAAADLVIVAAAGDATVDLPGTKFNPRAETKPLVRASTTTGDSVEFVVTQDSLDQKLKRSIWYDRGWTFQEYAFAQRSIVVFPDEVFFVCGDDYLFREAYEYTSAELDDRPFSTQLSVKYNHGLWKLRSTLMTTDIWDQATYRSILYEFTRRELTFEKDRLDALKGILSVVISPGDSMTLQTGLPRRYFG